MAEKRKLSTLSIVLIVLIIGMLGYTALQYTSPRQEIAQDEFGERVRAYLLGNPKVLREVIDELSTVEQAEAQQAKKSLMASLSSDLQQDGYSFVAGNPEGDVTIVEFFDYRCGYCKRSFPDLMKTVEEDGNIRLVLKEFPILGDDSIEASRAAIASIAQGKYMEFHTALMATRGSLNKDRILNVASDVGLDVKQLEADMGALATEEIISKNYALARKLGVNGTPAFVIGDHISPGALSSEQLLARVAIARENTATATN